MRLVDHRPEAARETSRGERSRWRWPPRPTLSTLQTASAASRASEPAHTRRCSARLSRHRQMRHRLRGRDPGCLAVEAIARIPTRAWVVAVGSGMHVRCVCVVV